MIRGFATAKPFNENVDYYAKLGLKKTATDEQIKKEFYRLAKKYHPDAAESKPTDEAKFKSITEAYDVLSNAHTKMVYDAARFKSETQETTYTYQSNN